MVKGKSPGALSNSARKKKLKPSEDDVTDVQNGRTEVMNGKTKKRKTSSEVCEHTQIVSEDNEQIKSTDPTKTDKCEDKKKNRKSEIKEPEANTDTNADQEFVTPKKKRKSQIPQKAQIEDTTLQQEDNTKKKKKTKNSGDVKKTPVVQEPCGEDEDGSGEEDLSPEEKRVLERKLKKIRKKEEKKKMKEEGNGTGEQEKIKTNVAEKQALEYLTCWSERRDEWKFQKSRQTWLLKHMYDSTKVPDSSFEVLLSYMEGLRGAAREISLKKAEVLVRWEGQGGEADTTDAADAEKRRSRAKLVMQQL